MEWDYDGSMFENPGDALAGLKVFGVVPGDLLEVARGACEGSRRGMRSLPRYRPARALIDMLFNGTVCFAAAFDTNAHLGGKGLNLGRFHFAAGMAICRPINGG